MKNLNPAITELSGILAYIIVTCPVRYASVSSLEEYRVPSFERVIPVEKGYLFRMLSTGAIPYFILFLF